VIDEKDLEQAELVFVPPERSFDGFLRLRDRKRRNRRIAAGVVGVAVFVAAVWIVTSGLSFDRSETSVVPGGDVTGPAETGATETGPTETGPAETGYGQGAPGILPVSVTDYLVDLETGATTPLPESIVGTEDVTSDYAVSPDGSRLAYVRRGDNGGVGIFVANLDGTGIEQVTNDFGFAHSPAWSPDGSKIAFIAKQGGEAPERIFLLYLATGISTPVTDNVRDDAQSPTFSPDGSSILYNVWRGGVGEVRVVPVAGGESERLVDGERGTGYGQLSPDGSLLSYACGESWPYDLCLANADGTDARLLVGGVEAPGRWSPDGTRIAYWTFPSSVYVVDVATGEETGVASGALPTWLDGHTLIVEADNCSLSSLGPCLRNARS
jgi:Tol biopolymer transport system component